MKKLVCLLAAVFVAGSLPAQIKGTGAYPFSSFDSKGFDAINLGNLDTRFTIPIVNRAGRGMNFTYNIQNEGLIWQPAVSGSTTSWIPDPVWGFSALLNGTGFSGYLSHYSSSQVCGGGSGPKSGQPQGVKYFDFVYHDPYGANHSFQYTYVGGCASNGVTGDGSTSDGSGYTLVNNSQIRARNGVLITPAQSATGQDNTSITDSRGNKINATGGNSFTDTLGVTALTITGSNPRVFTYPVTLQSDSTITASSTISYKQYTVRTNFKCSGIVEYGSTSANLVDRITLADGTFYAFTYEPTPSATDGAVTARLASITLPTGGVISYAYTGGCNGSGINTDGTTSGLTRTTSDGTKTYVRATVNANATSTTTTDEKSNVSVFQFSQDSGTSQFYETHRQIYQGSQSSAHLLMDQSTCYNGATSPCDGAVMALPILNSTILTSYDGISQATTKNVYNASGLLTSSTVLQGSTKLASTAIAYNGFGEVTSSVTSDASGNTVSSVTYGYDETTPTATSGIPQHTSPGAAQGNQTSSHVLYAGSSTIDTTTTYYDTGVPIAVTTPNGTTNYSYDATQTFATQTTLPTPSSGVALSTSATYDAQSTMPLSVTGMNTGEKTTVVNYDRLLRPVSVSMPDGGSTTYTYSGALQLGVKQAMNSSTSTDTETLYDGYGRVSRVAVLNGQSTNPWYQTDYCYDASGLLLYQSPSYQGTGFGTTKQCAGSGPTYSYDALGRPTSMQNGDGTATTQYTNRATLTKDVNGVQRITQYDLLGRISGVCEISGTTYYSASPVSCGMDIGGTGFLTTYAYDLLNHKTTITQGAQTRTFTTDAAGRTIDTVEPERGETTYSYAYNTTGLKLTRKRPTPNQTSTTTLTTTTTQYDSIGRVVSIAYDGTTAKQFAYDQSAGWGFTQTNIKGRLSFARTVQPGSSATYTGITYGYDSIGRVTANRQCQPSGCGNGALDKALAYTYDWTGNMLSSSDGAGVTTTYGVSPASEILSMTSSLNSSTNPQNLISNVVNGPYGPTQYDLGNGLATFGQYDYLGRLDGGWVCNGGNHTEGCQGGHEFHGFWRGWSGNRPYEVVDGILGQTSPLAYDEFNRLTAQNGTQPTFIYAYDRYGNRWQQNANPSGPQPQLSFSSTTNRITTAGYAYDAAGNLTNDGFHTYTYDAEGNVTGVDGGSTAQYVYDAFNRRVRTVVGSTATEYVFNANGQRVSMWNGSTHAQIRGQYYMGTMPVAYYAGGATHFQHQDGVGTERLRTTYNGSVEGTFTSLPFGDGQATISGTDGDAYHFAELDTDAETQTDHAQFRQYSSTQGRWMSPDPYDGSYDLANPQSFNRYAYALNNPLSVVDPLGLDDSYCSDNYCNVDGSDGGNGDDGSGGASGGNAASGGGSGGGGGGSSSSNTQAPSNVVKNLKCAAKYGSAHSIGAAFGGGTVANFLGGNSISSLVNLGLSVTGQQPFTSAPNLTGIGLGLPVNDVLRFTGGQTNPLYGSASGFLRSNALQGIFNAATGSGGITSIAAGGELAVQGGLTAGEFASGIGIAKGALDLGTFLVGYYSCATK